MIRLTPTDKQQIWQLLQDGNNAFQVAKIMGKSKSTIQYEVANNGGLYAYNVEKSIANSKKQRVHFSLEERMIIEKGLQERLSHPSIAKILNRNIASVRSEIYRNGEPANYNGEIAHEKYLNNIRKLKKKRYSSCRIENIEMQLEILTETVKELVNDKNKKL